MRACYSLSLQPFEHPVCTPEGAVFDLLNIVPYLKKYGHNPVSGKVCFDLNIIENVVLFFAVTISPWIQSHSSSYTTTRIMTVCACVALCYNYFVCDFQLCVCVYFCRCLPLSCHIQSVQ